MYTLDELKQMVFIDIETTAQTETLQETLDTNSNLKEYWLEKYEKIKSQDPLGEELTQEAAYKKMAGLSG